MLNDRQLIKYQCDRYNVLMNEIYYGVNKKQTKTGVTIYTSGMIVCCR